MDLLVQKNCGEKKGVKSMFGYSILRLPKKILMTTKLEGGRGGGAGNTLVVRTLEALFLRLP